MPSLRNNSTKFSAFVLGLLNLKALEAWLMYLRQRDQLLGKHYKQEALLRLASTSHVRLFDEIIIAVQPLAVLPFDLDISLLDGATSLTTSFAVTPLTGETGVQYSPSKQPAATVKSPSPPTDKFPAAQASIEVSPPGDRSPSAIPTALLKTQGFRVSAARHDPRETKPTTPPGGKPSLPERKPDPRVPARGKPSLPERKPERVPSRRSPTEGKPLLPERKPERERTSRPQMRVASPDAFSLASLTSSMRRRWGGLGSNIIKTIDKLMEPRTPTSPPPPQLDAPPPKPPRRSVAAATRKTGAQQQQAPIMLMNPMADADTQRRLEADAEGATDSRASASSVSSQDTDTAGTPDSEETVAPLGGKKWSKSRRVQTRIPTIKKMVSSNTSSGSDKERPETMKLWGKHFKHARAHTEHRARRANELSFEKGALLQVVHDVDRDWLRCQHLSKVGLVPKKCIRGCP
ncbi:PREDICTED: proteoglycan 4-like [Priapulus caudatus]|uniref:Proteoglycan 4-like n=1 Tax=Priapulus caudatus TaxID=37621 RepID=A0ABM1F755_PRICU|nr:PREDICTED: proteoglycan 4-like [Priapulus caudatus]